MIEALVALLLLIDLILVWLFLRAKADNHSPIEILKDIHEEKRLTKDLQASLREEAETLRREMKDLHRKMVSLATEAECEINESSKSLSAELDRLTATLGARVDSSVEDLAKQRTSLSQIIQKAQSERQLLGKSLRRAETLIQFFQKKIPVEEVLEEIEDKKYVDARHLLARGLDIEEVANEVGLPILEVRLLANISS